MSQSEAQPSAVQPTSSGTSASLASPEELLQELQRLREANQRWKVRFYASCFGYLFLFLIALVQFTGTFMTARQLHQSRQEAQRFSDLNKDIRDAQEQAREAQKQAQTAFGKDKAFSQALQRAVFTWDDQVESLGKRIDELAALHQQLSDQVGKLDRQRAAAEKDAKECPFPELRNKPVQTEPKPKEPK